MAKILKTSISKIINIMVCIVLSLGFLAGLIFGSITLSKGKSYAAAEFNNFASRDTVYYDNINGKTVTTDLFWSVPNGVYDNCNFGQGILLAQCIDYKLAHPEEEVFMSVSSFHFSVVAAVCTDRNSEYFGTMRSLFDSEYDDDGFIRISYLLVKAAKLGINVTVIGQIDAAAVWFEGGKRDDYSFVEYFNSHLDDDCEELDYIPEGSKVADFMNFRESKWTSYGDKSASDMMHVKNASVSAYRDYKGVDHSGSVWFGSVNLDAINQYGHNGNNGYQSAVIISDHDELYRISHNYLNLLAKYQEQEQVYEYRCVFEETNRTQVELLLSGRGNEIAEDEQIVYLGTESDDVFELYFTPLSGSNASWDTTFNPYCKYLSKLKDSTEPITVAWNNVKFGNFTLNNMFADAILDAFINNPNTENRLYLHLPGLADGKMDSLVVGENIGYKMINDNNEYIHSKDLQLSYADENGYHYVTLFNSLNLHEGSMGYQANFILVVKENGRTSDNLFRSFGRLSTWGCIE